MPSSSARLHYSRAPRNLPCFLALPIGKKKMPETERSLEHPSLRSILPKGNALIIVPGSGPRANHRSTSQSPLCNYPDIAPTLNRPEHLSPRSAFSQPELYTISFPEGFPAPPAPDPSASSVKPLRFAPINAQPAGLTARTDSRLTSPMGLPRTELYLESATLIHPLVSRPTSHD
jgi:hypothetical protein